MRFQWRLFHRRCHHHHHHSLSPLPTSSFLSLSSPFKSPSYFTLLYRSSTSCCSPNSSSALSWLFAASASKNSEVREKIHRRVSCLKDELVKVNGDSDSVFRVLEEMGLPLFCASYDGYVLIELLSQLYGFPQLAVEVFSWRRKHAGLSFSMTSEEYAKGITVAGRVRNVDLAVELFNEAVYNHMKTAGIYNALMGVCMVNGLPDKCQSLFREFKMDKFCSPTIITYNILLSVFGRLMLIDHMEATLQEIYDLGLSPTVNTFNNLIAGYVTAWMWDRMENSFCTMRDKFIEPDRNTYLLMLRGYAYSGNLKDMENMYELRNSHLDVENVHLIRTVGKPHSDLENVHAIRAMICAYCKSSCANRTEKIDALIKLVPEKDYRPWLIVLLIKVYAEELLLDRMESFINVAFEQRTAVISVHVMRSIITAYYRLNAVDKLTNFVKRAESGGWRVCRSLYHCKMVMYASQNRLEEMEHVLSEMERMEINQTKKTWVIIYKAYSNCGSRCKLEQVRGLMCKFGYVIP